MKRQQFICSHEWKRHLDYKRKLCTVPPPFFGSYFVILLLVIVLASILNLLFHDSSTMRTIVLSSFFDHLHTAGYTLEPEVLCVLLHSLCKGHRLISKRHLDSFRKGLVVFNGREPEILQFYLYYREASNITPQRHFAHYLAMTVIAFILYV